MRANQLRLYLSSAAYMLMHALRRLGLKGTRHGPGPVPYDSAGAAQNRRPNPSDRPPRLDRDVGRLSLGRDLCHGPPQPAIRPAAAYGDAPRTTQNTIRFVTPAGVCPIPPEDAVSHPKIRLPRLRQRFALPSDTPSPRDTLSQMATKAKMTLKSQLVKQAS